MWSYWCEHQENINYAWHMPVCVCESLSCVRLSMAPRIVAHPTRILQWIAIPICRGSSQPRDGTQVSNIAGGCFIIWATREIQHVPISRLSISIQAKFYIDNTFCLIHGIIMSYHGPPTLLLQTSDYIFTFDLIFNVWRCFIWGGGKGIVCLPLHGLAYLWVCTHCSRNTKIARLQINSLDKELPKLHKVMDAQLLKSQV